MFQLNNIVDEHSIKLKDVAKGKLFEAPECIY